MSFPTDRFSQQLLNNFQHNFPLSSEPFKELANKLNSDADTVLQKTRELQASGSISRIGPVFRPNTIGVSTLAAISVPAVQLEHYAAIVNQFRQVNHNYEREHEINLWFVLTAANNLELKRTIEQIERATAQSVLVLPMLKEYHIDLGFRMTHLNQSPQFSEQSLLARLDTHPALKAEELHDAKNLITAIQSGLPLVEKPYLALAEKLNCDESMVIDKLKKLIKNGAIKRFGIVVRHHELGYRANAMVVWDVANSQIDHLGKRLGQERCVTLCYKRPRVLPRWPYNLFCMIHGQNRSEVIACINNIRQKFKLESIAYQVLFSGQCFKQRGAHYHDANPTKQAQSVNG